MKVKMAHALMPYSEIAVTVVRTCKYIVKLKNNFQHQSYLVDYTQKIRTEVSNIHGS